MRGGVKTCTEVIWVMTSRNLCHGPVNRRPLTGEMRDPGSFPGHSACDFCWTEWQSQRFFSEH